MLAMPISADATAITTMVDEVQASVPRGMGGLLSPDPIFAGVCGLTADSGWIRMIPDGARGRLGNVSEARTHQELLAVLEQWRIRAARGTGKARLSLQDIAS